MHYLVTGHTGFKGSWLAVLLNALGHKVSGVSLPPVSGGVFETANVATLLDGHFIEDIRSLDSLKKIVRETSPDVIIHLAAQPIVLASYEAPRETFEINVDGTRNVIEAAKCSQNLKLLHIVTTDKVYRDDGIANYRESSPLGGKDPYSTSKAMADLLAQSYGNLGLNFQVAVSRGGNVIGKGDVSRDRLLPDAIRAIRQGRPLIVRMPNAVRPWQHVLDCLSGYLAHAQLMLNNNDVRLLTANVGPDFRSYRRVSDVLNIIEGKYPNFSIDFETEAHGLESGFLTLDSSLLREQTGWNDKLSFEDSVLWTISQPESNLSLDEIQKQVQEYLASEHKPVGL